jgi:hypothetical protein
MSISQAEGDREHERVDRRLAARSAPNSQPTAPREREIWIRIEERNLLPERQGNTQSEPGSLTSSEQRPQFRSGRISAPPAAARERKRRAAERAGGGSGGGRARPRRGARRSARGGGGGGAGTGSGRPVAGATLRRERKVTAKREQAGEVERKEAPRESGWEDYCQ